MDLVCSEGLSQNLLLLSDRQFVDGVFRRDVPRNEPIGGQLPRVVSEFGIDDPDFVAELRQCDRKPALSSIRESTSRRGTLSQRPKQSAMD